mmetsp:Transcript_77957/g.215535  ORF Transcript_77957/g.215535 Transcript_77957/m.215535 type:complete len:679 (-) Transcript_77957:213-2249(-)
MVSKCFTMLCSNSRAFPGKEGLPDPAPPSPAAEACGVPHEVLTSLWTASCWSPPAGAPSFLHSFWSSLKGSALQSDTSFKRGSSSKTFGISASSGRPRSLYSRCKSLEPMLSRRSHCSASCVAIWMLLSRFTGMPRASQVSAHAAISKRSMSSARCCSALAPRPESVRKDTESFMHSSLSSSTGIALQKVMRFNRASSSPSSFGTLKAEEGRPMAMYSCLHASPAKDSNRVTCCMALATDRMLPSLPTGTSLRPTQVSAHFAIMSRSASSPHFSASLISLLSPPFETRNSWHSLRSSLRGSSLQQAAHLRRSSNSARPFGARPASGGKPNASYSALRVASSRAFKCITLLIMEVAAFTLPSLRTGMPCSSHCTASHGVKQMPVTSRSRSLRRAATSATSPSTSSVGKPTLRHSSSNSSTGISCHMEAAFNRLSSSALLGCSSASLGSPSASCSASSSSSDSSSMRRWRSATFSARWGPNCCTRMPRASQGSRHMVQTKSRCSSSRRCSPFLASTASSRHSFLSSAKGSSSRTSILVRQSRWYCLPAPTSGGTPSFWSSSLYLASMVAGDEASSCSTSLKRASATCSPNLAVGKPRASRRAPRRWRIRHFIRSSPACCPVSPPWCSSGPPVRALHCRSSLRSSSGRSCSQTSTAVRQATSSPLSTRSANSNNSRFTHSA